MAARLIFFLLRLISGTLSLKVRLSNVQRCYLYMKILKLRQSLLNINVPFRNTWFLRFSSGRKLNDCCWDMQESWAKQAISLVAFKVKAIYNSFKGQYNVLNLNFTCNFTFNTTKQYFQRYCQSYCNYLLKNGSWMKSRLYINS